MPSAAASGTSECAGANAGPTSPRSASTSTIRFASGRPASRPERAGDQRHEQRLAGDQPADLRRRRAESAQHRGLPPALGDRERERSGDHEQGHGTGDAAQSAEDGDQAGTIRGGRVAGVGVGRVPAIEDLEPVPRRSSRRLRSAAADVPGSAIDTDRVDLSRSAGQRRGDRGREEHRGLALVAGAAGVGEAGDAVARVAGRRDDPQRGADACAQPDVGDHVARPAGRATRGQVVRRERRAVPAVADEPVRALGLQMPALRIPGAGREGDVADGASDARHGGDALDVAAGSRGPGMTSMPSASSPWPIVTVGSARTTASVAARRPAPGGPSAPAMSSPVAHASVTASQIATNAPASVARRARRVCSEMRSMSGPQSGQALGDLLGGRGVQLARRAARPP